MNKYCSVCDDYLTNSTEPFTMLAFDVEDGEIYDEPTYKEVGLYICKDCLPEFLERTFKVNVV